MKSLENIVNINEEQLAYDKIIESLIEAKNSNTPIDEGVFKALVGGVAGATIGPNIMKGVCKVLGIDERGTLGNLMTSKLVLTALGAYLGYKN